jgi:hypothetical protein
MAAGEPNLANNIWKVSSSKAPSFTSSSLCHASSNTFGIAILGTAGSLNNTIGGNNLISNSDGIYLSTPMATLISNATGNRASTCLNSVATSSAVTA